MQEFWHKNGCKIKYDLIIISPKNINN